MGGRNVGSLTVTRKVSRQGTLPTPAALFSPPRLPGPTPATAAAPWQTSCQARFSPTLAWGPHGPTPECREDAGGGWGGAERHHQQDGTHRLELQWGGRGRRGRWYGAVDDTQLRWQIGCRGRRKRGGVARSGRRGRWCVAMSVKREEGSGFDCVRPRRPGVFKRLEWGRGAGDPPVISGPSNDRLPPSNQQVTSAAWRGLEGALRMRIVFVQCLGSVGMRGGGGGLGYGEGSGCSPPKKRQRTASWTGRSLRSQRVR